MFLHGEHHFFHGQAQFFCGALHDADIGLMGQQPIHLIGRHTCFLQGRLRRLLQHLHRQLEYGLPIHAQQGAARDLAVIDMARHAQNIAVCTIGMDVGREDARLVGCLHDHSACAVAKQHAGGAVVEIKNARENFRTDHQRTLGRAAFEHGISHR